MSKDNNNNNDDNNNNYNNINYNNINLNNSFTVINLANYLPNICSEIVSEKKIEKIDEKLKIYDNCMQKITTLVNPILHN